MKPVCGWTALLLVAIAGSAAADSTSLLEAVKARDAAAVKASLKGGADINGRAPDGSTALAWAAHRNDLAIADLLIGAGADVNAANDYGIGPLALACENGSAVMVECLLRAGADADSRRANGQTALMTCARTGNAAAIRALVARGAQVNATEPRSGQTPLMWATDQNHVEAMQALIDAGADLHARSQGGYTPLLFTARAGAFEAARLLLAHGANLNDAVTPKNAGAATPGMMYADPGTGAGATALLVATVSGHWDLAKEFLDRGADPNASGTGFTALHWAAGEWEADIAGPFGATGYGWIAARQPGKLEFVKALVARGANVNARMTKAPSSLSFSLCASCFPVTGTTPLLLAANAGEPAIMRVLVAAGADPKATTNDKTTLLMAAAGFGRVVGESSVAPDAALEATKIALELGGDVRAPNDAGETALHGAAYFGADAVVQLLVDRGAQVNARNRNWGYTPLSIAERFSGPSTGANTIAHPTTAALLRKLGGEEGVEFEGAITQVLAGCPSAKVLVMPPAMGPARYGRGHAVQTVETTRFANGACADLKEGATVAIKGVREADYSITATDIRVASPK